MRLGHANSPLTLATIVLLTPAVLALALAGCTPLGGNDTPGGGNTLAFDRVVIDSVASGGPAAVMATDFDGDSRVDLVSVWKTAGTVRLHQQQQTNNAVTWNNVVLAAGSFAAGAQSVAVADLDADGRPDLLVGTSQGRILYLRQTGADSANPANWAASAISAAEGLGLDSWSDVRVANVDGDEQLEVVATLDSPGGRVRIFDPPAKPQNGANWLPVDVAVSGRNGAAQVLPIDMDGDKDVDLLTIARNEGSDSVVWYANPGAGVALTNAWVRHAVGHVANPQSMAFAYIDNDAFLDLLVSSGNGKQVAGFQAPQTVEALLDTSSRWNQGVLADLAAPGAGLIAADINGDNAFDIFVGTSTGSLAAYKFDGQTWVATPIDATPATYKQTMIVDLNKDGRNDLVSVLDAATGEIVWYRQK